MKNINKKQELVKYLLKNYVNEYGDLDLSQLDFGDFEGNIHISEIKCEGNIYQYMHMNNGNVHQSRHSNKGDIYQDEHSNKGDTFQSRHSNGGNMFQYGHSNKGIIHQYCHSNKGNIFQYGHSNKGTIYQDKHSNEGDIVQDEHSNEGNILSDYSRTKDNELLNYIELDGIRTYYKDKKEILGFTIYEDVGEIDYKYAITNGVFNAHCETIKGAIIDLRYKIETFNKDKKPIVDKIKDTQQVSKQDYRELTGACGAGVNDFCDRHNITTDTLPLDEVLELFKDKTDYGIKEFLKYIQRG